MFSGLGLSLLPLVFSLILTIASRLLHLYCTDGKTSRLMEKRFSTLGDTHRGLQSYMEKAMAPHSSTLAWKIPCTEESGGLQSMGSLRVRHD